MRKVLTHLMFAAAVLLGGGWAANATLSAQGATEPACWIDVYNHYVPDEVVRGARDEAGAMAQGRDALSADLPGRRAARDVESIAADPAVATARRQLYENARPTATGQPPGEAEWHHLGGDGAIRGVVALEQVQGRWRVLEEHIRVDGACD